MSIFKFKTFLLFCFDTNKILSLIVGIIICNFTATRAQIIPDRTLPNNSTVTNNGNITNIGGGTVKGTNLFHSFTEFSLDPSNLNNGIDTAYFNNASNITNIFSRVTGNSISQINGLIKNNGSANLFLINPKGIIFGENAALNLGGSFISSTANSIQFADSKEFSAVNSQVDPLLTVSIPVGLQYGTSSGDITVKGTGNKLTFNPDNYIINRDNRPLGLEVAANKTLALIGANIFLEGGNLTAFAGKVELGSVKGKPIGLNSSSLGWELDYSLVNTWGEIDLSKSASIDVGGNSGGTVRLRGDSVNLREGSTILTDTWGDNAGGLLAIEARKINIAGINSRSFNSSLSASIDRNAMGEGSSILIKTDSLSIKDGGQIHLSNNGMGDAGDLTINAQKTRLADVGSGLFSIVEENAIGNGANINLHTNQLTVEDGAKIAVDTKGLGNGGNLDVDAKKITLTDRSSILARAITDVGNGGDIAIASEHLSIEDGAQIYAGNFARIDDSNSSVSDTLQVFQNSLAYSIIGTGEVGNINIDANSISLNSIDTKTSGISTATYQQGGGSIKLNAESISIGNSQISTETRGNSHGGGIYFSAKRVYLNKGGNIITNTSGAGNAGKIVLQISDELIARGEGSGVFSQGNVNSTGNTGNIGIASHTIDFGNNSQISATNTGLGDIGTISMEAPQLHLAENTIVNDFDRQDKKLNHINVAKFWIDRDRLIDTINLYPTIPTIDKPTQLTVSNCNLQPNGNIARELRTNNRSKQNIEFWRLPTEKIALQNLKQISHSESIAKNLPVEAKKWIVNSKGKVELLANSCHQLPNLLKKT